MMLISRAYEPLSFHFRSKRVTIIYGARRIGKTTLIQSYLDAQEELRVKSVSGDHIRVQEVLSSRDLDRLLEYVEGYDLLVVDEAQEIKEIGVALKILADHAPELRIIATGSSSFGLSQSLGEPLTGRKKVLTLYPIAQCELRNNFNAYELKERLEQYLIYGQYPEVVTATDRLEKIEILSELVDSYILKDILSLEKVKGSQPLMNLLRLLAFQVGQLVSLNELASNIGLDVKTVGRYLDLLEKSFVIHSLGGFRRNLRREVTQQKKYYFLDNGIRNAIISNFNELLLRQDQGALWENFLIMERVKRNTYSDYYGQTYFWRSYTKQELDFIEDIDGKLSAYEFKWSSKKRLKIPKEWKDSYPDAAFHWVTPEDYLDFVLLGD